MNTAFSRIEINENTSEDENISEETVESENVESETAEVPEEPQEYTPKKGEF